MKTKTFSLKNNSNLLTILLIVCVAILANITVLKPSYYPKHDTLTVFQFFSYFYSEIIYSKEIPLWLPYTAYGIPSDSYLLFSFGPFQYLSMFVGYIFKINNSLRLFSASLILESMFLMFSSYIFLNHILKSYLPTIISVIFIGLLAQYDIQLYWNFKILLPIPLCLYLTQKWIETLNTTYVLAAFANLLIWSFGSLPYVIPFQFYTVGCYGFFMIFYRVKLRDINKENILSILSKAKSQATNKKNLFFSIIALISTGLCISTILAIKHVMHKQMAYGATAGRQSNLKVSVDSYINHGGFNDWHKITEMLTGFPFCKNFLLPFTGIVCISFAIIGIFTKNKTKSHISLIITTLFVLAFSMKETYVARIIYYLPGMNLFRHIGYVITIGKMFVVMLAGFGIKSYLQQINKIAIDKSNLSTIIPALLAITSIILMSSNLYSPYNMGNFYIALAILGFTILNFIFKTKRKFFVFGLMLVGMLEVLNYNRILDSRLSKNSKVVPQELVNIKKSVYKATRTPPKGESYFCKDSAYYGVSGDYLQKDFVPSLRQDITSKNLEILLEKREDKILPIFFGRVLNEFDNKILTSGDPKFDDELRSFLGENSSKIKLTGNVIYVNSNDKTLKLLPEASLDSWPIIKIEVKEPNIEKINHNIFHLYTITNTYFSANKHEFLVNNISSSPLWLIYADTNNRNWSAYIDGIKHTIYPANFAFKAIQIQPGLHKVDFVFSKNTLLYKLFFVFQILFGLGIIGTMIIYPINLREKLP